MKHQTINIIKNLFQYLKISKETSILKIASNVLKIKRENKHNCNAKNVKYHSAQVNVSKVGIKSKDKIIE